MTMKTHLFTLLLAVCLSRDVGNAISEEVCEKVTYKERKNIPRIGARHTHIERVGRFTCDSNAQRICYITTCTHDGDYKQLIYH